MRPNTHGTVEGRLQGTRKIPLAKGGIPSAFRRREDVNDSLFPLGWKLASTHKSGMQGAKPLAGARSPLPGARVSLKLPPSFVRLRRSAEDAVLCRVRGGNPAWGAGNPPKILFFFFRRRRRQVMSGSQVKRYPPLVEKIQWSTYVSADAVSNG